MKENLLMAASLYNYFEELIFNNKFDILIDLNLTHLCFHFVQLLYAVSFIVLPLSAIVDHVKHSLKNKDCEMLYKP